MLSVTKAYPISAGNICGCFNIKLNDCDTNVSSNAAVAFLGTTVTSNDDTLALQSSAAGSAQNVGIQILDRTGEVLIKRLLLMRSLVMHSFHLRQELSR